MESGGRANGAWEFISRTTRKGAFDGAQIVGIVKRKQFEPCLIVNAIYRPPVNRVVLEFPGGLIDEGESVEKAALRELKEETGYVGQVLRTTEECQTYTGQ
jgi:8-oxo-dGTP pyrophosphatase MutT (NUDIX family)